MSMSEKGFTLVELMMATAVMGIILGSIALSLKQGNDQMLYELPRSGIEMSMGIAFDRVERVLRSARITAVAADGSSVDFQVPVDHDADGDVIDGNFNCEWGVVKSVGQGGTQMLGATGTILFVRRADGAVLSEPALNTNININTEAARDENDVFDLGGLVFTCDDDGDGAADWRNRLAGGFILQPSGTGTENWGKDVDGDGTADPIFRRVGDYLEVVLIMGRAPTGVPPIMVRRTVKIFLRNQ